MGTRLALPLLAAAALGSAGCYTTWDIAPKNVATLHVDPKRQEKVIVASNGDDVVVDRDTELRFRSLGPRVPDLDVKFDALDVYGAPTDPNRQWWMDGVLRGDGRGIRVDMNEVASLTAKRFSPGKTTALIVGVVAGAAAVVGLSLVAVVVASSNND